VPSATIRPLSSRAIRLASRSASSRYWVVRRIVTPSADELADRVPHHPPAARVEAGRRLVEEDDPRLDDERHRQVEPAAHAARVRHRRLRGGVDEVEPLEQLAQRAAALLPAEVMQVGHQAQVLLARELAVDRRHLAGERDASVAPRRAPAARSWPPIVIRPASPG
jgi:hypothetical protein